MSESVMSENSGSAYAKRHLTRLSGYSYAYRQLVDGVRTDRFLDGTTLAQVLALYDFDRRLKLLTLDALERIEIAV